MVARPWRVGLHDGARRAASGIGSLLEDAPEREKQDADEDGDAELRWVHSMGS
jgi:hypothetical protein